MFLGKLRKRWIITPVAAVLILLAAELWLSAEQESQTFDESAHMYAGDSYWKPADFGGNPEHPLLGKLDAALPLLRLRLKVLSPTEIFSRGASLVEGTQFLYLQDADALLFRSRVAVKVFAFFLGILVFLASAAIAAISVAALWAFLGFRELVADRRLVSVAPGPEQRAHVLLGRRFHLLAPRAVAQRGQTLPIIAALAVVSNK